MIVLSPYGIITWITVRLSLLIFYGILAAYLYEKHKTTFSNPIKNLLYSVFFVSMIVGVWELPLFIFGAEHGLDWAFNDVLCIVPFIFICYLFNIKFNLGKKELGLFAVWCIIASIFAYINILAYNTWNVTGAQLITTGTYLWNYDISYAFRITTFIFFYLIFRRIKTHD